MANIMAKAYMEIQTIASHYAFNRGLNQVDIFDTGENFSSLLYGTCYNHEHGLHLFFRDSLSPFTL
jgi:hypothetical protein